MLCFRWVNLGDHKIKKEHRQHLYWLFKALVYAKTKAEFDEKYEELKHDSVAAKYSNYLNYINSSYMGRVKDWATYVRLEQKIPTHGMNTAAYSEQSFGITKDEIFQREKCFNFPDMLQLLLEENSRHWTRKCIQIANNQTSRFKHNKNKYFIKTSQIKEETIVDLGGKCFEVESENEQGKFYSVNMVKGFCSCPVGISCGPYKHKFAVSKKFKIAESSVIPTMDPRSRSLFYFLATGTKLPDWHFRPLTEKESLTHAAQHIEEVMQQNIPIVEKLTFVEDNSQSDHNKDNTQETKTEEERVSGAKKEFEKLIDSFKDKIIRKLSCQASWTKSVQAFNTSMKRVLGHNDSKLEGVLFNFAKERPLRKISGRKKQKTGKEIPVQPRKRSIRKYKQSGR